MRKAFVFILVFSIVMCLTGFKKYDKQKILPQKKSIQTSIESSDNLYLLRLQSVNLSHQALSKAEKPFAAQASKTYLYVVVTVDGYRMWFSPKQEIKKNQLVFDWSNDETATFAIPWNRDSRITLQAFVTDDLLGSSLSGGAVGGLGGAGLGAIIGGVAAGVVSGGLGAPAGAAIGAAIGGAVGSVGGATVSTLSVKDQLVTEKVITETSTFPLGKSIVISSLDGQGGESSCSVVFKQTQTFFPKQHNELNLKERYLVRIKEIKLSEMAIKKGKKKDKREYYLVLKYGKDKYKYPEEKKNLWRLLPDHSFNPQIYTIFNNTGEETQVAIYQKNRLLDDRVFSSKQAALDGGSWIFQGKAISSDVNDKDSYIVFETFGPVK